MSDANQVVVTTCRRCGRETVFGKYGHVCAACVAVQQAKSPVLQHQYPKPNAPGRYGMHWGMYENAVRQMEDRE